MEILSTCDIIRGMKLPRKIDRALILVMVLSLAVVFGCFYQENVRRTTYAEGESTTYEMGAPRFVTFYDEGEKLTVKTEARTVGEALERAGLVLNAGDIVDPGLETEINVENFFINIYRARPVVVKDGVAEKYLMTASYDLKTIAHEAGLTIYDGDRIEMVPNDNFLESGVANIYEVTRNGGHTLTVEEEIPFGEERTKDYNLAPGTNEVRRLGEVGTKQLNYEVQYVDGVEVSRKLVSEAVVREPVSRIVAEGASQIEKNPLTPGKGTNTYTTSANGSTVLRKETYYDLPMAVVMRSCGGGGVYTVREDGAKVDKDGFVLVAAHLGRYPRCSVVETSLGPGKVYDTGGFAASNPEQFDLATDWSNKDGV